MARRLLVIALVAGVTGASVCTGIAQPVTRPSQVTSTTAKSKATATKKPKTAAKATSKRKTKSKTASKTKTKTKSKRIAAKTSRSKKQARLSTQKKRGPAPTAERSDNMPRGFVWPPSPAMLEASKVCETELDQLGVRWERATPEGKIVDPITIPTFELGGITYTSRYRKGPHRIDCQFARVLAQIGPMLHDLGVREVKFGSIFRDTQVRAHGVTKPMLSRHALGLAMDIFSFVDSNGRESVVETDYPQGDLLLIAIEHALNGTGKFRIVLSPSNDPISHADHFHIEAAVDFSTWQPLIVRNP